MLFELFMIVACSFILYGVYTFFSGGVSKKKCICLFVSTIIAPIFVFSYIGFGDIRVRDISELSIAEGRLIIDGTYIGLEEADGIIRFYDAELIVDSREHRQAVPIMAGYENGYLRIWYYNDSLMRRFSTRIIYQVSVDNVIKHSLTFSNNNIARDDFYSDVKNFHYFVCFSFIMMVYIIFLKLSHNCSKLKKLIEGRVDHR